MEFAYAADFIFTTTIPSLRHGNDGLIFTSRRAPYKTGTCEDILKWKPLNENTVDVLVRLSDASWPETPDEIPLVDGLIKLKEGFGLFKQIKVPRKTLESLGLQTIDDLDRKVVEVGLEEDGISWSLRRIRDDKDGPNYVTVVESIMESIEDAVSEEALLEYMPCVRKEWKQRAKLGM